MSSPTENIAENEESNGSKFPNSLQCLKAPILSNTTCRKAYPGLINNSMMCLGFLEGGKDACQVGFPPSLPWTLHLLKRWRHYFWHSLLLILGGLGGACGLQWNPSGHCLLGCRLCPQRQTWSLHQSLQLHPVDSEHHGSQLRSFHPPWAQIQGMEPSLTLSHLGRAHISHVDLSIKYLH